MTTVVHDEYVTLKSESGGKLSVQGSRFIAVAHHAGSAGEAEDIVARERKAYHDASHHCYAYRLGTGREAFRYSDDGEPSGTGGKPILAAIDREGLTDIVVVVTRYFGGIKLGTGGLGRAYGGAARIALAGAAREVRFVTRRGTIAFSHELESRVRGTLARYGARVFGEAFGDVTRLEFGVRASRADALVTELRERTGGKVEISGDAAA